MVEADRDFLDEEEVREALSDYIQKHPQKPAWWPVIEDKDGTRGFGYGTSAGENEVDQLVELLQDLCVFL
jgi:hypothetical protein